MLTLTKKYSLFENVITLYVTDFPQSGREIYVKMELSKDNLALLEADNQNGKIIIPQKYGRLIEYGWRDELKDF